MRLAVISDVHSNLTALKLILKELETEAIDEYLFLGDYITDGYQDNEVIELVRKYATHAIIGNRDKIIHKEDNPNALVNRKPLYWTLNHLSKESKAYLKTLPEYEFLEYGKHKILMIHGDNPLLKEPYSDTFEEISKLGDFELCILGHLHINFDYLINGQRFVNAGSSGIPADGPYYKYLVIDIGEEINVQYKTIPTAQTFDALCAEYQASDYFKANTIWGTLTLDAIQQGDYIHAKFFEIVKKVQEDEKIDFLTAWEKSFEIYTQTMPTTYSRLLK